MTLKFIETKDNHKFGQREMLICFCALLIFGVSLFFPQKMLGESFWLAFFLFAFFPIVVIAYLLKETLTNFGISRGKFQTGLLFSIPTIILFIAANYFLVFHSASVGQLSIANGIANSFTAFLLFEIFIALPLHFFWEIFFRGFVQLGLEKKLGIYSLILAVALQTIPFLRGNWIVIGLIFFSSLGAGLIARQSRSILYSALAMWLISISLDIMIIRFVRQIVG